jgi:putative spermidine/putrescine transport system substrate-binding protein
MTGLGLSLLATGPRGKAHAGAVGLPDFPAAVQQAGLCAVQGKCGCEIVVETGNNADRIAKLDARRNNPVVDLVLLSDFGMLEAARKGLVQPLDYSQLKNYSQIYPFARNPIGGNYAVGYTIYSVGLVYRSDKTPPRNPGRTCGTRTEGPPGPAGCEHHARPLALQMADLAWGGKGGDYAAGMQKILSIKNNVVTFTKNSAQLSSLFAQDDLGRPVARFTWSQLMKTGMPLKWAIPAEGQAAGMNVMGIVAKSKNADLAYQLMDFWLSKEVQTALAMELVDSPVNTQVVLPKDKAEFNTYGGEHRLAQVRQAGRPAQAPLRLAGTVEQGHQQVSVPWRRLPLAVRHIVCAPCSPFQNPPRPDAGHAGADLHRGLLPAAGGALLLDAFRTGGPDSLDGGPLQWSLARFADFLPSPCTCRFCGAPCASPPGHAVLGPALLSRRAGHRARGAALARTGAGHDDPAADGVAHCAHLCLDRAVRAQWRSQRRAAATGLADEPQRLLFTEMAVFVGLLQCCCR